MEHVVESRRLGPFLVAPIGFGATRGRSPLAPNVLLIPGASSVDHPRENLAVSAVQLDPRAVDRLSAM
jgi:hypothetical protein